MRLRLSARESADLLYDYLKRCGCLVRRVDDRVLEASGPPQSLNARLARLELEAYLRSWGAIHPDDRVEILGPRT
jgi:hypothetical protein